MTSTLLFPTLIDITGIAPAYFLAIGIFFLAILGFIVLRHKLKRRSIDTIMLNIYKEATQLDKEHATSYMSEEDFLTLFSNNNNTKNDTVETTTNKLIGKNGLIQSDDYLNQKINECIVENSDNVVTTGNPNETHAILGKTQHDRREHEQSLHPNQSADANKLTEKQQHNVREFPLYGRRKNNNKPTHKLHARAKNAPVKPTKHSKRKTTST